MKQVLTAAVVSTAMVFTGCATIFSGSTQTLSFKSVPDTAKISIMNSKGESVHAGSTPTTVSLKRGSGFFKSEKYQIKFEKEGYLSKTITVSGKVNGWYIGNIAFGGILGLLIIDPMTGAMYKLTPDDVTATLEANNLSMQKGEQSLTVLLVENVPTEIMQRAEFIQ